MLLHRYLAPFQLTHGLACFLNFSQLLAFTVLMCARSKQAMKLQMVQKVEIAEELCTAG